MDDQVAKQRREIYETIRDAFTEKYSFLGAQVARECLLSAASWNIQKHSDPPYRFRNHVMLTWEPGWVKTTILMKLKKVLGDDMVSTCGKVTEAVIRGSVEGGRFSPPKPLRTPILISTEFGQTNFEDELLHTFLNLLEEGHTNVSLNKIAQLSESEKSNIQEKYGEAIKFKSENEFDLHTNFVFWGATHDPSLLDEYALKSRFNIITPAEPLTGEITHAMDTAPSVESMITEEEVNTVRRMLKQDIEVSTNFKPPAPLYKKYKLTPRESRDVQSYMAARNWWGLKTDPNVMESYIQHLKQSRKIASLDMDERVLDMLFDNPLSYDEIQSRTGLTTVEIYKILQRIDAKRAGTDAETTKWVVRSGENSINFNSDEDDEDDGFLSDI